jgi:hypothetical protein
MNEAIRQQGGVVRSFTGDGIMAVFGAPTALEDAPLRACRAALNILQRLKLTGPDLEAKHIYSNGRRPRLIWLNRCDDDARRTIFKPDHATVSSRLIKQWRVAGKSKR